MNPHVTSCLDSVMTSSDGRTEDCFFLLWRLARITKTSQLLDSPPEAETGLASVQISTHTPAPLVIFLLSQHLQLIHLSSKKRWRGWSRHHMYLGISIPSLLEIRPHMN